MSPSFPSREDLSRVAGAPDRGGLTRAGRALQKHGSRSGSAFPRPYGNPDAINTVAQQIVEDILSDGGSTWRMRRHVFHGDIVEIHSPDGRGLRYDSVGEFLGFLEP